MSAPSTEREPTDLELMMLLDGELTGERRAEVEAFLAESADEGVAARAKLGGMRAVSRVVATFDWPAMRSGAPEDVADSVMAAIADAAPRSADAKPADARPVVGRPAEGKPLDGRPIDGKPIDARSAASSKPVLAETPVPGSARRPANDNSRTIFGVAIAAVAAAAALFFWGKADDGTDLGKTQPIAMTAPGAREPRVAPIPSGIIGDLAGEAREAAQGDPTDDPRYGVEVASVDFGARSGAIYYVPAVDLDDVAGSLPGADKAAVTTVVWLNDD